eukprot:299764_1
MREPVKLSQIRGCSDLFIYLRQDCLSTFIFVTALTCVLLAGIAYSINFHPDSCYLIAGVAGIVSNLYGFCHFRRVISLNKQNTKFSKLNDKLAHENEGLKAEVNRFTDNKNDLKDTSKTIQKEINKQNENLEKFEQLNKNLEATGKQNLELLGDLKTVSSKMEEQLQSELHKKDRKILIECFERFEWDDDNDLITQDKFKQFKATLPIEYQQRFVEINDWKTIEDGGLLFHAFVDKYYSSYGK